MTTTRTDVADVARIRRGDEADRLATAAYDRLLAVLTDLAPGDWDRPTECTGWSVHDMVAHVLGAARGHASPRELVRQGVHARRHRAAFDGNDTDAMNAHQIARNGHLPPAALIAELRGVAPLAVRGRRRVPSLLRRIPVPLASSGSFAPGTPTSVRLGELLDVTLTRDVWLHRIDIERAVGREPAVDAAADRRIVADIVVDWAGRHRQPVELRLHGPAGGTFVQGDGGPVIARDAVEFCRILSGRAAGDGLLATKVLF
jgi:uncharacterized protein (TIGR03083 family)